MYVNTRSLFS